MTQTVAAKANARPEPEEKATTALARRPRENFIAKLNMTDLTELGEAAFQSGMFADIKNAGQAKMKILAGHELGFTPVVSLTEIHFFQGKPVIGAKLLSSLIKDSGKYEYKIIEHTDNACKIAVFQRFGDNWKQMGVPVVYTIQDAANAKLTDKDNWKKYPKDMLFAACIRQAARRYCADILRGTSVDHALPFSVEVEAESQFVEPPCVMNGGDVEESAGLQSASDNITSHEPDVERADPEPIDQAETRAIDLQTAAIDQYGELKGKARESADKFLGAKTIKDLDVDELREFLKQEF